MTASLPAVFSACLVGTLIPSFAWSQTPSAATASPAAVASAVSLPAIHASAPAEDRGSHVYAEIETSKGPVEAELDFRTAPLTTLNFIGLAEGTVPFQNRPPGKPFFDGLTFHRVVKDFVIQGGDPLSADPSVAPEKLGDGGPGYSFPDEFSPGLRHDHAGVLSMANDGPNTNGSQFFITLHEVNRLNYLHSVFGQVVHGLDVIERIEPGDVIKHVTIRRVGVEGGSFRADAAVFAKLRHETLEKRHPTPADLVYLEDGTKQLPDFRVKNFNFKLANYERTTGHRIAVRLLPAMSLDSGPPNVGSATKKIAATIGFPDSGDNVLLCYFASIDSWGSRLGEATYPALIGEAGTTEQLMASGAMHDRKSALLAPAQAQTKAGKLKEGVDAAIDTVILALDDFTLKTMPPK